MAYIIPIHIHTGGPALLNTFAVIVSDNISDVLVESMHFRELQRLHSLEWAYTYDSLRMHVVGVLLDT